MTLVDQQDVEFIINWLSGRRESIRFANYPGKTKLLIIRKYRDHHVQDGDEDQMELLRGVMADDWQTMLDLPAPEPEDLDILP